MQLADLMSKLDGMNLTQPQRDKVIEMFNTAGEAQALLVASGYAKRHTPWGPDATSGAHALFGIDL